MGKIDIRQYSFLMLIILIFILSGPILGAQTTQSDSGMVPEELLNESLYVQLKTTVVNGEQKVSFQALATQLCLPGRAVKLDLKGTDGRIVIMITPYPMDGEELTLVAQTEIWTQTTDGGQGFFTTFTSVVVSYGETTVLYPYGGKKGKNGSLKVGISIDPYNAIAHTVSDPSELYTEKVLFPVSGVKP